MLTRSGDYKIPGRFSLSVGNAMLGLIRWVPSPLEKWIHKRHHYYQRFRDGDKAMPGDSSAKWNSLGLPADLTGKSIVDIGCSEGFFCLEAAKRGASHVLGIDARLTSLVCARLIALKCGVSISYRLAVFPDFKVSSKFDFVLCLSLLHHLVSTKDIWKVVSDRHYSKDMCKLQQYFMFLRSITREGGCCIIEMPYEYDDISERESVDFDLLTYCLQNAGFTSAGVLSQWPHSEPQRKDRVIYFGRC